MEARRFPRFDVPTAVGCRVRFPALLQGEAEGECTVVNLSLKGCRVAGELDVEVGEYLSIHLQVPNQEAPIVVDLAGVRWVSDHACGLEFVSMWPSEEQRLGRFLRDLEMDAAA